jgi:hypothetical protein
LPLQTLSQNFFVEAFGDEVFVGRALARDDRAADVDEREDEGRVEPLVLGLDVISDALVGDVGVESCDHKKPSSSRTRATGVDWKIDSSERLTSTVTQRRKAVNLLSKEGFAPCGPIA